MGNRKNPAGDPSGITLVELLIAITIAGLVMGLTATMLRAPQTLVRDIATSTQTRSLEERQGYFLADRFSRAHSLRRNYFTCNSGGLKTLFETRNTVPATSGFNGDVHWTASFTVPYTSFSSLGAWVGGNDVRATDASKIGAGDLVLLSAINHPTVGGLFIVASVDRDEGVLTLSTNAVEIPVDFRQCAIVAGNNKTSLTALMDDSNMVMYGEKANSFRLDVIRLARYFPKEQGGELGAGLFVQVWPGSINSEGAPGPVEPAVPGFQSLDFSSSKWVPDSGTSSANGNFSSVLTVRWVERSVNRKQAVEKKVDRAVANYLSASGNVNLGGATATSIGDMTYPSCGLALLSENGNIQRSDFAYGMMTRVDTVIADAAGFAGVEVAVSGGMGQPVTCWNEAEIEDLNGFAVVPPKSPTTGFTIGLNAAGVRTTYICEARPGTTYTGTYIQFVGPPLNKLVRRECGVETTPSTPYNFSYDGAASQCFKTGEISLGRLVATGTTEAGPALFLTSQSCDWESDTVSFTDCDQKDRGNLLNVRFFPTAIPGIASNDLTCVDPP